MTRKAIAKDIKMLERWLYEYMHGLHSNKKEYERVTKKLRALEKQLQSMSQVHSFVKQKRAEMRGTTRKPVTKITEYGKPIGKSVTKNVATQYSYK